MALARVQYEQKESGNKNFTVPFPYISRDHIKVSVDGEDVPFSWLNDNTVQLDTAPPLGAIIDVRRETERNVLLVDFQDGSTLTEYQLDLLGKQSFYLVQEADDIAVESNSLARAATEVAQAADEKADQAVETANTASGVANEALGNSEVAVSLANAASISAANAEASALAANEAAQAAAESASTATQTAAQIEDIVEQLLEDVQDIAGADLTDFAKNSENLSGLTDKAAARSALGLGTAATRYVTTGVDDLTAGRLATIEQVRRRIRPSLADYTRNVVLLHPVYNGGAPLPLYIVDGSISAFRGSTSSLNLADKVYVVSSASHNNNHIRLFSVNSDPSSTWEPVTCLYGGTKYIALKMPYKDPGYTTGVYFEGRIHSQSSDPNILKIVDYYNEQTKTVLNAEIYNSITPAPAADHLRIGNSIAYHTGNIAKLISDGNLVQTSRTISTGTGLTGGGDLSANRTISLAFSHYPIGVSQTWQDVTWNRAWDTTYTNTTSRPIAVYIRTANSNSSVNLNLTIGGQTLVGPSLNGMGGSGMNGSVSIFAIIPPGANYSASSNHELLQWCELRA